MKTIGLVLKPGLEKALKLGEDLLSWSRDRGYGVLFEERSAEILGQKGGLAREELVKKADPIVTLGGDGTLISMARHVGQNSPVLVGVHFGHLGFLTEISPSDLFQTLERLFAGKAALGERSMIVCEVSREGKSIFGAQCINDAVIQKGARDKLLELDLAVDDEEVMTLRGDGLIVATPTGSTAYSLAAGGSIAHPELGVVLVTPICAHSLTVRPLVLSLSATIQVKVPEYEGKVFFTADGQISTELKAGDIVNIGCSPYRAKFVKSDKRSYFSTLRTKLNWGIANRGE